LASGNGRRIFFLQCIWFGRKQPSSLDTATDFHGYDRVWSVERIDMYCLSVINNPFHAIVSDFLAVLLQSGSFTEMLNISAEEPEDFSAAGRFYSVQ